MSRKHKANLFLTICALLIGAVIYFMFMSEKAVAPEPKKDFITPTKQAELINYQTAEGNHVQVPVLMYHHVGPLPEKADDIRRGLTVSTEEFDEQLAHLKENGYKSLTLAQLSQFIDEKKVPSKAVVLTFDDGYDDNFTEAFKVMKKHQMVGTFFIITSKIDKAEYMKLEQLQELLLSGNEIGSHSVTHPSLEKLKGSSLEKEILKSKEELEEKLSTKVSSFCYPAGKYNDETIKAVMSAGYKMAVTTRGSNGSISLDNLFEISRYRISENMSFSALFR